MKYNRGQRGGGGALMSHAGIFRADDVRFPHHWGHRNAAESPAKRLTEFGKTLD